MASENILKVINLRKSFDRKSKGILGLFKEDALKIYAVDNISFELKKGETLGLIGESGCGKSTTAKLLLKLLNFKEGQIEFKGRNISKLNSRELSEYRKKAQMIFQDPYEYINPRMTTLDIIAEPLVINKMVNNEKEKIEKVIKYLEYVDLKPATDFLYRYSHELSGGQRQRVAIARSLILDPDFVVADEPTSMLDVSVRAGILNLLSDLKKKRSLSMIFITHDIVTAGYMCDRIAVMYKGRIVEIGPKKEILFNPKHPYTKALLSVANDLENFMKKRESIIKDGEVDNYFKSGACTFIKRCVMCCPECHNDEDHYHMQEVTENHYVACCRIH